jgi:hypothetical protein
MAHILLDDCFDLIGPTKLRTLDRSNEEHLAILRQVVCVTSLGKPRPLSALPSESCHTLGAADAAYCGE